MRAIVLCSLTAGLVTLVLGCAPAVTYPAAATGEGGTASGELPATPSRGAVVRAMASANASIHACFPARRGGRIAVRVVFASTGEVAYAEVALPRAPDDPYEGPRTDVVLDEAQTDCIQRALRAMRVPPFTQRTFIVNYPYAI
ncbi:MAG: hypothetical protein IT378_06925 [Sandaracinaceae bacterium]|nr:hypothetical protein [Sandaracinaceae bacterium]